VTGYRRELETALAACSAAGRIQLDGRQTVTGLERKPDNSPVSDIDRRCERTIIDMVAAAFPSDGVLGEEGGARDGTSGRRWIVDPLDGTRPYLRGIPTYSALLALEEDGVPVVGVIHLAALGHTCWACRGGGAFLDGAPIRVSQVPLLSQATGSGLGFIERRGSPQSAALLSCMAAWDYAYGFMDAYTYVCVASGRLELCVNLLDKPWDCAAAACIVTEAGGAFSDISGNASVHNGSFVISNGVVHKEALDHFSTI